MIDGAKFSTSENFGLVGGFLRWPLIYHAPKNANIPM